MKVVTLGSSVFLRISVLGISLLPSILVFSPRSVCAQETNSTIMTPEEACVDALGYVGCENLGHPYPAAQLVILHWAAVAISPSTLTVGGSHGQNSQQDAEQTALTNCRRNGARDCEVLQWVRNECQALAVSYPKGPYGWSDGSTRVGAAAHAMSECKSRGGQNCTVIAAPCAVDDIRWTSPLPLPPGNSTGKVDPKMVGTWYLSINPGYWVWRVSANGTYEFHSEAVDNVASNAGSVSSNNGHYTLHAINLSWDDTGTYHFQDSNTLIATGKLGTGTWHRLAGEPGL
jgi:Domain of unknown function (DUF4189)